MDFGISGATTLFIYFEMMKAMFHLSLMNSPICIVGVKELWPLSRLQLASVLLAALQRCFTVFPNFVGSE